MPNFKVVVASISLLLLLVTRNAAWNACCCQKGLRQSKCHSSYVHWMNQESSQRKLNVKTFSWFFIAIQCLNDHFSTLFPLLYESAITSTSYHVLHVDSRYSNLQFNYWQVLRLRLVVLRLPVGRSSSFCLSIVLVSPFRQAFVCSFCFQ